MTVSFDAQSAADTTGAAATSFSDSTNLTVGSGTNRALLVCIAWSTSTAPTGISLTWNGVALTQLIIHSATSGSTAAIFGLLNPDSGTNTLAGSWTGARDFYVNGISYTEVIQTNTATAFLTNFGIGTSAAAQLIINAPVTDAVLMSVAVAANITNMTNGTTPGTQVFVDNTQTSFSSGAVWNPGIGSNMGLSALNTSAAWVAVRARIVAAPPVADPTIKPREAVLSKLFQWVYAPAFQPYNPSLYSVVSQAPFFQTDWSKPFVLPQLPPQPAAYNLNLFTNPIPFGPFDYGDGAFRVPPFRPDPTQPFNANLYTNPIPFAKFDYPPVEQPPWAPPQALPYNINIFTNPIPFGPFDYSDGAFRISPFRPDATQPLNPNIFTNPFPFTPVDYSAITPRIPRAPDQAYYNLNVYSVVVIAAPFVPIDYSKPFFPRILPPNLLSVNIQLFTNPFPFVQTDWSTTKFQIPRAPDASQSISINLLPDPTLFMLVDWTGSTFNMMRVAAPDPRSYNLALYTSTPSNPFIPIDWSKPFPLRSAPAQAQPFNLNLFTNPIPFAQYYWPLQFNVPQAQLNRSVQTNINLFKNPIPFVQNQYPGQRPVRIGLIHIPPYNQNLYSVTPAPGQNLHVVKFIGNMGHFMIR